MKTPLHCDDLTYAVLLAAVAAFAFATVLEGAQIEVPTTHQTAARTLLVAPNGTSAVASALQSSLTPR